VKDGEASQTMTRTASSLGLLAILVLGLAGCSQPRRTEDPETTNLRRIYQAFRLCDDFKHRGPKDADDLKHWLGELGEPGTPEEFLISRRDGKPFVVLYGTSPNAKEGILAYEAEGKEGKRLVLTREGSIQQWSDEEVAAKKPGKK